MLFENGMIGEEQKDRTVQQRGSFGHVISLEASIQRPDCYFKYADYNNMYHLLTAYT